MGDHADIDHTGLPGISSGAVGTDPIWDTAGDLAVGTGANTAARLAIGNAGGHLARINGAVAWDQATSFPTAAAGDRFFRSDLLMEFINDGTRWKCTCPHTVTLLGTLFTNTTTVGDLRSTIAATASAITRGVAPSLFGGSDIWLVDHRVVFNVNGGATALGASHKWVGTVVGFDTNTSSTGTVATVNIDSGSSAVFRAITTAIGAVQAAGTLWYGTTWTKTGTPGNIQTGEVLSYRIIAT